MTPGDIIEFDAGDRHLLGAVMRNLGDKSIVVTEEGDEMRPTADDVTYEVGRSVEPERSDDAIRQKLEELREASDEAASELDAEFLWEFVKDRDRVAAEELAELFFESDEPSRVLAVFDRLRDDPVYFKARKDGFEPRSDSQVESIQEQLEAERRKERRRQSFVDDVVELLEEDDAGDAGDAEVEGIDERMADEEFRRFVDLLQEYAIHDERFGERERALELLDAIESSLGRELPGSYGTKAFRLMVELGIWHEHENLWLHRYNLGGDPDASAREHIEMLEDEGWDPEPWRRDLTDRRTFSIDAPETRDVDDAISCRELPDGGWEIGIHIADPDAYVDPDTPLDRHARKRGTSVYLPSRTVSMFPETVSEDLASLVEGELRPAVSVLARFDEDRQLEGHKICGAVVEVDDELTYERADALLDGDADDADGQLAECLHCLETLTDAHRNDRTEEGGVAIDLPDPDVRVDWNDGSPEVDVEPEDDDSTARDLVSECMILANTLIGKYCRLRSVPIIYRTQPPPDRDLDDESIRAVPEGLPRQFALIRRLEPGNLTTEPDQHFGLGVSTYAQASSPLRRYADLICHRQLKATLADEPPPYDADEMVQLLGEVESTTNEAGRAQSGSEKYWILEYLRRNDDREWPAVVIDHKNDDGTDASVWVHDVAQKFDCRFRTAVPVGEQTEVVVNRADPRRGRLSLEQA